MNFYSGTLCLAAGVYFISHSSVAFVRACGQTHAPEKERARQAWILVSGDKWKDESNLVEML